ncbi:hypothetical protein D3C86_1480310 [compost metagenome]
MLLIKEFSQAQQIRISRGIRNICQRILVDRKYKLTIAVILKSHIRFRVIFLPVSNCQFHDSLRRIDSRYDRYFINFACLFRHVNDHISRNGNSCIAEAGHFQSNLRISRRICKPPVQISQERIPNFGINLHKRDRSMGNVFLDLDLLSEESGWNKK